MIHPVLPFTPELTEVLQGVLWALMLLSILLTLRAIDSGTWSTMWVAALVSLTASLIAIWSIGSLIFLLTCVQLAVTVAIRWSVDWRGWTAALLAGIGAFGLITYGLAFVRAWDLWLIAMPLTFALASLLLSTNLRLRGAQIDDA